MTLLLDGRVARQPSPTHHGRQQQLVQQADQVRDLPADASTIPKSNARHRRQPRPASRHGAVVRTDGTGGYATHVRAPRSLAVPYPAQLDPAAVTTLMLRRARCRERTLTDPPG
jgi:hypothetical protein